MRWLVLLLAAASATVQTPDLQTRAETSAFLETSSYDDVMRIVNGVVSSSPLTKFESFGTSEEGRALPLLILSEPAVASPEAARRLGRPIVFVQANIHAGEVEGKEAALILARRLASGDLRSILKQLVVLIAPIYNADGNEKVDVKNRPEQNGPEAGVGTRENAKGLDLNRDYMKLESAEARALVGLMTRWDPHVTIDLHTTNGSYHGYHLTYSPALNPNADSRLIALTRERLLPAIQGAVLKKHDFRTYFYGNFAAESGIARETAHVDPANPGDTVWRTFDHRPRFGNNYVGLRNRVAILSEAFSYLDFRGRVRVTEVFVEEALRAVAANSLRITALTTQLDGEAKTFGTRPPVKRRTPASSARGDLGVEFRLAALPAPVEILVGDVETRVNPRSGLEMLAMTDKATPVRMRDYGVFEATRTQSMPRGWLIPRPHVDSGRYAAAIDRLRWHGVAVQRVAAAAQIDVERFVIASVSKAEREFQGHHEARVTGKYTVAKLSAQEGALFIPAAQPLARLAFYLLEPESDDGLVTWNFMDAGLVAGDTYPIYRVVNQTGLKLAP
jgi:zinc carboxypeptidase